VDGTTPVDAAKLSNLETAADTHADAINALDTRVVAEEAMPDIPAVVNGQWLKGSGGAAVWAAITEADVTGLTTDLAAKTDKATLTAKGDIYAATAASAPARVAAGAANTLLQADSAQAAGVRWGQLVDANVAPAQNLTKLSAVTGTPTGAKYLRDDGSWQTPPGSGATGAIQLTPGEAALPDGSANNASPALVRIKGTEVAPNKFFLTLAFDATAVESGYWSLRMPSGFISSLVLRLLWMANATAGAIVWAAAVSAITPADADTPLEHAFATAATVTTNVNATEARRLTESIITISALDGAAVGDLLFLRLYRDAANAADTCAVDGELINVNFEAT
jgi:hypothetical protein